MVKPALDKREKMVRVHQPLPIFMENVFDKTEIPDADGPCCICGKEATHKHLDDKKNYCDKCCDSLFFN